MLEDRMLDEDFVTHEGVFVVCEVDNRCWTCDELCESLNGTLAAIQFVTIITMRMQLSITDRKGIHVPEE